MDPTTETMDPTTNTPKVWVAATIAYYSLYGFLYLGFLLHRSAEPLLLWYSGSYLVGLVITAVPFLVPTVLRSIAQKIGWRRLAFAAVPATGLLVLIYVGVHLHFDFTREYPFDPYLQLPTLDLTEQYPRDRPDGVFRIVTLGGSTTKNRGLEPDDRYPRVLERLLQARYPDHRIEVINAGQDWWSTQHSLINYLTYVEEWDPDMVIVMHGFNDMSISFAHPRWSIGEFNQRWTHYYGSAINAAKAPSFEETLVERFLSGGAWFSVITQSEVSFPVDWFSSRDRFRNNLERLARYLRADGATPVFVTQPFLFKSAMPREEISQLYGSHLLVQRTGIFKSESASPSSLALVMAAFNSTTVEVAAAVGAILVEGEPAVPKTLDHFVDEVHYTPVGAELLATAIADAIVASGEIDGGAGR